MYRYTGGNGKDDCCSDGTVVTHRLALLKGTLVTFKLNKSSLRTRERVWRRTDATDFSAFLILHAIKGMKNGALNASKRRFS